MWAVPLVALGVESSVQRLVASCPMCFEETLGEQVLLHKQINKQTNEQTKMWVIFTLYKDTDTAY